MADVLVLVLAADVGLYREMTQAIRETWGPDFRTLYYYGRTDTLPAPPKNGVLCVDDVLVADIPEGLYSILPKTLMVYDYVHRHFAFDYVFRCCSGSYLRREEMQAWLAGKPTDRFYAGFSGPFDDPAWSYASGSGYFLSRDLVRLVADHAEEITSYYPEAQHFDDVAVGRFLASQGVTPIHAPRVNGTTVEPGCFHYHIPRNPDLMREFHASLRCP